MKSKKLDKGIELLLCKDMVCGMRVTLTNPDGSYTIGESNPEVGTLWECEGTVIGCTESSAHVRWENGKTNTYADNDLSPTYGGRCKSIW